ncbi:MAG: metallophosphoesterase family protein [archaeon]
MKIAVISDMHLGYKSGTEREEDAFKQTEEAMDKAIEKDVDLILLPGDIFDEKTPSPETWSKALKILKKPLINTDRDVEIKETIKGKEKLSKSSVPIVAIHGTHERRSKGYVNPIEMLEHAGYLTHLHCEKIILKINGEEIAIHGMSGVPEEYTGTVLKKFNPKPVEGMSNIFMFHQSLEEYIYDPENTFIKTSDLPKGFDLYIDGHIHWHNVLKDGKTILFPGSTVTTQMRKIEAEKEKGFYIIDTDAGEGNGSNWKIEFIPLEKQRPFKFIEIDIDGEKTSEIIEKTREEIRKKLGEIEGKSTVKPMLKVKLKGKVPEAQAMDIDKNEIKEDFDAIIKIDKDYEAKGLKRQIESLRKSQREKKSIRQKGMEKLKQMLGETDYNSIEPEILINMLSEKDATEIVKEIMKNREEIEEKNKTEIKKKEDTESKVKTLKDF